MVNIGDTVEVTIPTYWPGFFDIGFGDPTQALQNRLEQAGVGVESNNAGALHYLGDSWLRSRSNLVIVVRPFSSAYGTVQDVANLVAGAAYAEGFDINAGATGRILAYAHPAQGSASSDQYDHLQDTPDRDPDADKSIWDDIAKALGISTTTAQIGVIGLGALAVVVVMKTR